MLLVQVRPDKNLSGQPGPSRAAWATMYHVGRNGQQTGPFSIEQLNTMAANGELQPTDLVWKEGMAGWEPASTLPGVFTPAPAPAPGAIELPPGEPRASCAGHGPSPRAWPRRTETESPGAHRHDPGNRIHRPRVLLLRLPLQCGGHRVLHPRHEPDQGHAAGTQPGMGMAQAGLWCSIASLVIAILLAIFGVAMGSWQQFAPK